MTKNQAALHQEDEYNVRIGAAIERVRKDRGLSREKLGNALGISFQQIHKYESGTNRVSSARLAQIADVLNCHPMALLRDCLPDPAAEDDYLPIKTRAMLYDFERLSERIQNQIRELIGSLADEDPPVP